MNQRRRVSRPPFDADRRISPAPRFGAFRSRAQSPRPFQRTEGSRDTSWNKVATWYEEVVQDPDSYQQQVLLPGVVRLCETYVKNDISKTSQSPALVDIGCGTGAFSIALSQKGYMVTGIDAGPDLITVAKNHAKEQAQNNCRFVVMDAQKINLAKIGFEEKKAQGAIAVLSLQNIEKADATITSMAEIVSAGGSVVVVLNHPSFRIPKITDWYYDERANTQYRRIPSYMSEQKIAIDMNPGSLRKNTTWSFHRPLQWWFKAFEKSGLSVVRLEEWMSHKKSENGPRKLAEDRARKEIPMFLALVLKKDR